MKGHLFSSLLSCIFLTAAASGDTLVPAGTLNEMTSPADAVGDVSIEGGGRLKLSFTSASLLSNNIANNGMIGDYSQDTTTLSGTICGAGDFYKAGTGTTVLSGSNTYTGWTWVNAGTLRTAACNVLPSQSWVYLAPGASFDLNNSQQSVGSISGSGGAVTLGTAPLPSDVGLVRLGRGKLALGANSGFGGVTATVSSIEVNGSTITSGGSLSLGCAAVFSGALTISGATLNGAGSLAKTDSGTLTWSANNAYNIVSVSNGTLALSGNQTTAAGSIDVVGTIGVTSGIIGSGIFTQSGSGTVFLTGTNSYTGATTLSGGVLSLNNASNSTYGGALTIISGGSTGTTLINPTNTALTLASTGLLVAGTNTIYPLTVAGVGTTAFSGTLGIIGGNNVTLSNNIGGTGSLVLGAPSGTVTLGMLTLNGINTYTGATILNAGMLNLAGGSLANNTLTVNGGGLVLSGTNFSGNTYNLSGSGGALTNLTGSPITISSGSLVLASGQTASWINNAGVVTFTGSSGVIGTTTLSGSTFALTVGTASTPPGGETASPILSREGNPLPPVSSSNAILITGNDNANRTFAGNISGNGSIIKTGTGYWNLTGNNTYTGLTTVADGLLSVNGSVAGDVYVWGGILGGSGVIGGSVLNQSVVSPGNSPGTLTVAGDYAQSSAGYLLIQLASPTVFDRLIVGGQASLDGGVAVQFYHGFLPKKGESFVFLTAAGGIDGKFSQLVFPSGTLLYFGLEYQPNSVILDVLQGSFAKDVPNLTPNERAVGAALDKVVNSKQVSGLVDKLDSLSLASVPGALDQIAPTELLTMFDASIASASVQADNLERRMEEIRDGSTGFSGDGLHLTNSHGEQSAGGSAKQAIGKDGKELAPAPLSDRWGFFINGSGEFVDVESNDIAHGTDFTTGGISTGADYRLGNHAAAGVTAGYSNTSASGRGNGPVQTNSGKLGLYGTVFDRGCGFFLNGALGGGLNNYDTQRETLGGTARGETEGTDFNTMLGTGYTYHHGGWSAGPVTSLRYSWVGIDGFTERGSLTPLRFGDQSESSLKSTAGLQASYVIPVGKMTFTPQVRAQWQHEYLDDARSIGASFLPGGAFSVQGPEVGRDGVLIDAGLTVQLNARIAVYGFYTGDLWRKNYSANSVNGGVQIRY